MFYATDRNDHGLPHDPFKAIVAPRPIGWITSMSARGAINLAPYSYFNGVHSKPPMVMFASEGRKDSLAFVEETKEFVCNLATWDLRQQMNQTSAPYPRGTNELTEAGLTPAPCRLVKAPRVAEAPCALECKLLQIVELNDIDGRPVDGWVVFGRVVGVHIDERYIRNGLLDTAAMKPIARGGYHDYSVVLESFTMRRPASVAEAAPREPALAQPREGG
jgi:flavin reductase (DIM6/NTAB) family NADH-FMN oxidoreductase RutF